jgi:hypothetical protein
VIGRVPVARGHDQVELAGVDQLAYAIGDRIAVGYRERATLGEVVLEVDDQERAGHNRIIGACGSTS